MSLQIAEFVLDGSCSNLWLGDNIYLRATCPCHGLRRGYKISTGCLLLLGMQIVEGEDIFPFMCGQGQHSHTCSCRRNQLETCWTPSQRCWESAQANCDRKKHSAEARTERGNDYITLIHDPPCERTSHPPIITPVLPTDLDLDHANFDTISIYCA